MTNNARRYKDSNYPSILSGLLMFRKEMCPWIVWTPVEAIAGIMKIHIMFCLDYREFQHILCNNVLCNNMIIAKGLFIFRYFKGNANSPECFDTDLCCLLCFLFCFFIFLDCNFSGFEMHDHFVYILYDDNDFDWS